MTLVERALAGFSRLAAELKIVRESGQGKITGTPGVGKVLHFTLPNGILYADVQWRRNQSDIPGANSINYTQTIEDIDCVIDCVYKNIIRGSNYVTVPQIYLLGPTSPTSVAIQSSTSAGTVILNIESVEPGATPEFLPNDGRFVVAGDEATGWKLVRGLSAISVGILEGQIVKSHPDASNSPFATPISISVTSERIAEITTHHGGRAATVPQQFFDIIQADANDPNTHPTLGASTHYAVKNGLWSDPTTWNTGTVPGENAIVRTMVYTVTYDVESDVKIKDLCVCNGGRLQWDITKDTRLRVDTIISHGVFWMGDSTTPVPESTTTGKPRVHIKFWQSEAPGATSRLGLNTMGPTRIHGAIKSARLTSDANIPAGATTATLTQLGAANWRVGDKILFVGTTAAGTSASDAQYTGPTSVYLPYQGTDAVRTRTRGYRLSHDEVKTITNISGNVVTFDTALVYNHNLYTDTLPHGQTATVKPMVANLSRSIKWESEETTPRQKRAHSMFMHNDDQDVRFVETMNMGRTDTDPSLATPDGRLIYTTAAKTTSVTDPVNVRGRYPLHFHWTGAYFGRRQVAMQGCTAWAPTAEVPIPGWGITHHASRAAIEDCVVYNVRGAGIASELGNETGQWINNLVCWVRGDGFDTNWGDRAEFYTNHNGHVGVGYECQARQVLCQGNHFSNCHFGWIYHQQIEYLNPTLVQLRTPIDTALRLWDPISNGGDPGGNPRGFETYGLRTAQIPDWNDNGGWSTSIGFFVAHRGPERQDAIPMIARRFHCVNVGQPFHLHNYSNTYYFYDSFWVQDTKSNTAGIIGTVSWRFMFVNLKIKNYSEGFRDIGGGVLNYDGFWIDIVYENVDTHYVNKWDGLYMDAATHHQKDVMGDWIISPTDPKQVIARTWNTLSSTTDLPQPFPREPYGRKLPAGYAPVAPGQAPYFVLGNGTSTSGIDTAVTSMTGTAQLAITGIIRDCVADRRYPDHQGLDTGGVGLSIRGSRTAPTLTGEGLVIRNGCFNDAGVWKSRLWFTDADRFTGNYFQWAVDVTLTNFTTSFLEANVVNPNIPPQVPLLPEAIPPKALVADTSVPVILNVSQTVLEKRSLSVALKSNKAPVRWEIIGGTDQGQFVISGHNTLNWVGSTQTVANPEDANGDNVYEVTVRATDLYGNTSSKTINISVSQVLFSDTFTDTDGTLITAHTSDDGQTWAAHPAYASSTNTPPVVNSYGRLMVPTVGGFYYLNSMVPSSPNYWVEFNLTFDWPDNNQSYAALLRWNATTQTGYMGRFIRENGFKRLQVWYLNNGSWGLIGSKDIYWDLGPSPTIRFTINGNLITGATDGKEIVRVTHNSVTAANRVGLYADTSFANAGSSGYQLDQYRYGLVAPPSGPILVTAPVVTGGFNVGNVRTVTMGDWSVTPDSFVVQWFRDEDKIIGANSASYTQTLDDVGHIVEPRVTAVKNGVGTAARIQVTTATQGTPWVPADWTGKVAWYDATDNTTVASTTNGATPAVAGTDLVRRWADKSGNANHLSEVGNYPSYVTDALNGKKAVKFTAASSQRLTCSNANIIAAVNGDDKGYTLVAAIRRGSIVSSRTFAAWSRNSNTDYFSSHNLNTSGGATYGRMAGSGTFKSILTPNDLMPADEWYTLTYIFNGTTVSIWIDGTLVVENVDANTVTLGTGNIGRLILGAMYNGTWYNYFDGAIGEMFVTNDTTRTSHHSAAEAYLAAKFGVT